MCLTPATPNIVIVFDAILSEFMEVRPDLFHLKGGETIKKYTRSIVDTVCKLAPFPPLDEICSFTAQWISQLPKNPANKDFGDWLFRFKGALFELYPAPSQKPLGYPVERLVKICRGNIENDNHIYRARTLWGVLVNLQLDSEILPLDMLLPKGETFTTSNNSEWKDFLSAFTFQMYYYRITKRLVDIKRCNGIRSTYKYWEDQAGGESAFLSRMFGGTASTDRVNLPSQQLSFPVLVKIMPHPEVVFGTDDEFAVGMDHWVATMSNYVIAGLSQFPVTTLHDFVAMNEFYGDSDSFSSLPSHHDQYSGTSCSSSSHDESLGYISEENIETYRFDPYNPHSDKCVISLVKTTA
eukprot:TRINITY_DN956_c0_g1_i4.p1 TRINITY_DN956_c0_g1~~TRINITY_DN956_c0_g1_i4.p1  ORF type:complete len:353 (+),score=56.93 TRINITY_DN956_c0_g1_i4:61-1119(+)